MVRMKCFRLRGQGYKIFVVSAHPVPGKGALEELKSKIVDRH